MDTRLWKNEFLAFWLAPLVSVIPLAPLFAVRSSPLFLGKLMADATHPMNLPGWGPWLSSMAVAFDGTILAYVMAFVIVLPVYLSYRHYGQTTVFRLLTLFCLTGVCASQLVHLVQSFRQPGLRDFANSWWSPLLGGLCGLAAGLFFAFFRNRPLSRMTRTLLYPLPAAVLLVCGFTLVEVAQMWKSH